MFKCSQSEAYYLGSKTRDDRNYIVRFIVHTIQVHGVCVSMSNIHHRNDHGPYACASAVLSSLSRFISVSIVSLQLNVNIRSPVYFLCEHTHARTHEYEMILLLQHSFSIQFLSNAGPSSQGQSNEHLSFHACICIHLSQLIWTHNFIWLFIS